jgi:hypothetical protein
MNKPPYHPLRNPHPAVADLPASIRAGLILQDGSGGIVLYRRDMVELLDGYEPAIIVEYLSALAEVRGEEWVVVSPDQWQRMSAMRSSTLKRWLARLVRQGVLVRRKAGRQYAYRIASPGLREALRLGCALRGEMVG